MPARVTIVQGQPDPGGKHLCHALADAYAEGAAAAGHEITRIEVARLDFPILRTQEEFERGSLPETLVAGRDAFVSAQHLVMIFPLWHGTMPALLQGLPRAGHATRRCPRVSKARLSQGAARGPVGEDRRHDGDAGVDLQVVLPSPRSARA